MVRKLAALLAISAFLIVVAGCNTIEGLGKDIKATGGAVEKAAEKTKPY